MTGWLLYSCSQWISDRKECLKAAETAAEQDVSTSRIFELVSTRFTT